MDKLLTIDKLEILKKVYKFDENIQKILNEKYKKPLTQRQIYKKIIKSKKPPISNEIIQLFYNEPKNFFENHETLLKNTSYYDECDNSIFAHYFNILYNIFIKYNYSDSKLYISNFYSFFVYHKKYLTIQDASLETPLHKIAKLRNNYFFIMYFNKLKRIKAINEEILFIKNIYEKSCIDYILQEIKQNRTKYIRNNFDLYNDFFKSIENICFNKLSVKNICDIKLFSLSINFDEKLYKDIKFKEIYRSLFNLFLNVKDAIIDFDFFDENINIFNCLYHFSELSEDNNNFNMLLEFISNLLNQYLIEINDLDENIIENNKIYQNYISNFIYTHIGYAIRKMNKKNTREYAGKLIREILPILITNFSFDQFKDNIKKKKYIKLKFNINSLGINLINNPNLNFEEKYEIFNLLYKILGNNFYKDIDEDNIYLYKLVKFIIINNLNVTIIRQNINNYFSNYKFIRKIISDNFFIRKLYREIYYLCNKYDKINLKKYIDNLSKFINNNKDILSQFKLKYSMNNDKIIKIILNIIIIFEEKNYNTKLEEKFFKKKEKLLNKNNQGKFEKLYKQFILSNPKLISFTLKDIITKFQNANKIIRKKLYSDYLDLFFSFKYDFTNEKNIPYCPCKDFSELKLYEKKLKENLPLIKKYKYEFSIYKFILKFSPHINETSIFNLTILRFKLLMKKYLNQLVFKWNEDCDFSELADLINEDILPFCKLFLNVKDSYEDRKNKIDFFFDEFVNALFNKYKCEQLNPDFKTERYQQYKQLALNYMEFIEESNNEFFYNLDYKIYFSMMLIFIRLKFGKFNPYILYQYTSKYNEKNPVFLLFLKAYFNNDNKNDIPYHFFLLDNKLYLSFPDKYIIKHKRNIDYFNLKNSIFSLKEVLLSFISYISPILKNIDFSLIFHYIKSIINKKSEYDINSNYDFFNSFKFIFLGISLEQNRDLFNKIIGLIFSKNIVKSFFSFLDIDPILFTEENIKHKIKVLKQISLYIEENRENTNDIFDEVINEQTFNNIISILILLRKEKRIFLDIVKDNKFLLQISLNYLLRSYYYYLIKNTKKNSYYLSNENEDCQILKKEIYNFLDHYKIKCESNNEYTFDFSQILFSICQYDNIINYLKEYIIKNIYSCKTQILNNYGFVDTSFFKSILENDLLMLLLHYMYIIKENKNYSNNNSDNQKREYIVKINKYETFFFLNEYSNAFICQKLKKNYEKYLPIFYNLESFHIKTDKEIEFFNEYESNDIYFVLVFIYIRKVYPSYNPSFLYYIYNKFYTLDSKKFFISFMNCIKDKENRNNIHIHLLLEKDENNLRNKKYRINLKKFGEDLYNKKILIKNYIVKHLLDLNYTKDSFFYEYIDNKINKAFEKNKIKQIDYVLYFYTQDKNQDIYNKIIDKFNQLKISFFLFLKYDNNIINEENMKNIIKLLENLSKKTKKIKYSESFEDEEKEKNEQIIYNDKNDWIKYPSEKKEKIKMKIRKEKYNELSKLGNKEGIVEQLSQKYFLIKNEKNKREILFKELSNKYDNVVNKIKNLFTFFKVLKQLNKRLIDIIQDNYIFLRETIEVLILNLNYSLCACYNPNIIKEINDKKQIEYLKEQIYDFFKSLFSEYINTEMVIKYLENPIIIKNEEVKSKLLRFFENIFIQRIKKPEKYYNYILDNEYLSYKQIITKFCKPYFNNDYFQNTFIILFEKDLNKFKDLYNNSFFEPLYKIRIINLLMRKNLKKLLSNKELFVPISFDKIFYKHNNLKNFTYIHNNIVLFILNNGEEKIYSNFDFINNSVLFNNLDSSLFCLRKIYNQKATIFIINIIQKKFKEINSKNNLFLELIKRQINNNHAFNYIFNSFNENEVTELFQNNKNILINSLYDYSEINAYQYIEIIINKLTKFIPLDKLKDIVFISSGNEQKYEKLLLSINKLKKIKNFEKKMNNIESFLNKIKEDNERKNLLFYSLLNNITPNYETIAFLFEHCQNKNYIYNLFSFITDDFTNFYNIKIMKLVAYNSNKSNKERIKNIGKKFYIFLEFFEKIANYLKNNEELNEKEKIIFYYYIMIINLQIIPKKLKNFLTINYISYLDFVEDIISQDIKAPFYLSEKELFIILILYEIRGNQIISIKNILPILYYKVKDLFYKFEKLDIPKIKIGIDDDEKYYEHFNDLITKQTEFFLKFIPHFSHKNLFLIIQKHFSLDINKEKYLDNYVIDLFENEKIITNYEFFYLNLKNFYNSIKENEINQEQSNFYKFIILSLRDFNSISEYIIRKDYMDNEKNNKEKNVFLNTYKTYLEIIKEICHYLINEKENYLFSINFFEIYNINEKIENKLKKMKENLNLNSIILAIKNNENPMMKEEVFSKSFSESINYYISSDNKIKKQYEKISKEKTDIISYFKLLSINCNIIIKIIEIQNKIYQIMGYSIISKEFLIIEHEFQYNKDKINSKKSSEDSIFELANDILDKLRKYNKNKIKVKYKVNFYFNEKKENFVETYNDNDLINFIQEKYNLIATFFNNLYNENSSLIQISADISDKSLYIKKLNEKIIYNILKRKLFNYNFIIGEEEKEKIISVFFSCLFKENQNLISSYLKNIFDDINKPNYEDFIFSIEKEIDKIIYNYLEPCLSFNFKIYNLLKLEKDPIIIMNTKININSSFHRYNYNNYINLSEIIFSILSTKYHSINNLNSLFQIKSLINKAMKRHLDYKLIEKKKFIIKIEEGKTYTSEDFIIFQKSLEMKEENQKKENKDTSIIQKFKKNKTVQYKLNKFDIDVKYNNNYFPFKSIYYLNGEEYKHEKSKSNYFRKKAKVIEKNNFINVYDLIFTIKEIDQNNTIIIQMNDISEILKHYSKEETFNSLVNNHFCYIINEEEEKKMIGIIKKYLKAIFN